MIYALAVRLGILGPARGDLPALARAAQHLLDEVDVDSVIYLGEDDALDRVVTAWARDLVGEDPSEQGLFERAARICADGTPEDVMSFVAKEHARSQLKIFSSVPSSPGRTIELLDGRVVLLLYDKALLDEEDIVGATVLVFGKSPAYLIKRVGVRTFISPGPIGSPGGGAAILDDTGGGVRIAILDGEGRVSARQIVGAPPGAAKLKVQGSDDG